MSHKTKIQTSVFEEVGQTAKSAGIVLMALAATAGLVDMPQDHDRRAILPMQPSYAFAGVHSSSPNGDNTLRRERDDISPHYVSYSAYQRTPARSGKH